MPYGALCFLALMAALHILMLSSVVTRLLDPLTYDAAVGRGWDFGAVYYAGVAARSGLSLYDTSTGHTTGYRYLPFTGVTLGQVLSFLPFNAAYAVWVIVGELILVGFVVWLLRPRLTDPWRLTAAGMILGFYPLYGQLCAGQFDIVQGFLIALILVWVARGRDTQAAGVWTLSVLFKLNTLIQLVPLVRRRRFVWVGVGLLSVVVLSAPWLAYIENGQLRPVVGVESLMANFRQQDYVWFGNHGLRYVFFLLGRYISQALGSSDPNGLGSFFGLAASSLVLTKAVWLTMKSSGVSLKDDLLLWIIVFYLCAAEVWEFSYVAILFPIAILFVETKTRRLLVPYALLAFPTLYWWITLGGPRITQQGYSLPPAVDILYHSVKPAGMLALFGCVIRLRQRAHAGRRSAEKTPIGASPIGPTE